MASEPSEMAGEPSEDFAVSETIEKGEILVTAHPEMWIIDHILYWPPGVVNRSIPIPPESDWTPVMCRVLQRSIATYEEAIEIEKRYSKHRDSDSFRNELARRKRKREHPVNENSDIKSNLINANSLLKKIDLKQDELEKKKVDPEPNADDREPKTKKFHSQCLEKDKRNLPSGESKPAKVHRRIEKPRSVLKKRSNPSNLKGQETKKSRYPNYLQSGKTTNIGKFRDENKSQRLERKVETQNGKKMGSIAATTTKAQFLKENALTELEFQSTFDNVAASTPINQSENDENVLPAVLPNYDQLGSHSDDVETEFGNLKDSLMTKSANMPKQQNKIPKTPISNASKNIRVLDNVLIKPAEIMPPNIAGNSRFGGNFENLILSSLNEIKNFCKRSEEARIQFEARMQTQWDLFVKKVLLTQGQNGQAECIDETEDFDDFDQNFPIEVKNAVEELEWAVQRDLIFKRRMKNRIDQLGGKNPNDAIRSKMKFLFKDTILEGYTWKGTFEKKSFEKLTFLNDLIYKSVRSQFREHTYKEYKNYMVQWLKHSKSRQRTVVYRYPNREQHGYGDNDDEEYGEDEEN